MYRKWVYVNGGLTAGGRWAPVHFGVEVASTDHLLETESRERPLLHRIATEHLNLTQLQPQAIEGSLNVDIMH